MAILTIDNKDDEKFLRKKMREFAFEKYGKKEIRAFLKTMREVMHGAHGIGLAANQIGIDAAVFVVQNEGKSYALFNPIITHHSAEKNVAEEGCLSVPKRYGERERSERVVLEAFDANGRKIKIKAWGLLARIFQHETDHLNGKLFIDEAKNVHEMET